MDDERRQRRLDRVGHAIRIELAIGFLAPVVVAFVYVAAPGGSSSMFEPLWVKLVPWIGGAGVLFGLAWLVRISRPNPESGEADWRYRDLRPEHLHVGANGAGTNYEQRSRRMDWARSAIRAELMIGVLVSVMTWFLFVASPGYMCCFGYEPSLVERLTPWVGAVVPIVGLFWMVRLSRPRVEVDERTWRYRDFR